MATTKRAKNKSGLKKRYFGMDIATIILAVILSVLFVVSLFAKPAVTLAHGKVLYLDGIISSAIILGAMVWALIESLTPPGGVVSLTWRAGIGLLIGGAAGAYIGYSFNFAQYVIVPIFHGNFYAELYVITILIFGLAVIWDAAWSHRHGYLGQGKSKKASFKESGRSKGYRQMVALLIALIAVFLMIPASAGVGTAIASLNDHNAIPPSYTYMEGLTPKGNLSHSAISQSELRLLQATNSTISVPATGAFVSSLTAYLPAYITKNSTGANITNYIQTVYLGTNITLGNLSAYVVQDITLSMALGANYSIEMGTGNATSFTPLAILNESQAINITYEIDTTSGGVAVVQPDSQTAYPFAISSKTFKSFVFPISAAYLTGNQSQKITFRIQTENQTEIEMISYETGATSPTLVGSLSFDDVGYVIGSIFTLIAAVLVAPWIDMRPLPGVRSRRMRA